MMVLTLFIFPLMAKCVCVCAFAQCSHRCNIAEAGVMHLHTVYAIIFYPRSTQYI